MALYTWSLCIALILCQLCQQVSSSRVAEGDLVSCSQPPENLPEEPIDISCSVKVPEAFRKRIQAKLRDSLDERGKDTLDVVLRLRGFESFLEVSLQEVEGLDVTGGECYLNIYSWSGPRTCYLAGLKKTGKLNGNTLMIAMLSWIDQFSPAYGCTEVTIDDASSIKEMYVLSKAGFYYQSFGFRHAPSARQRGMIGNCKKMISSLFDRKDSLPTAEFNLVKAIHEEAKVHERMGMIYKKVLDVNINDGAATLEPVALEQLRGRMVEGVEQESGFKKEMLPWQPLRIAFDILKAWPEVIEMTRECVAKRERIADGPQNPQAKKLLPHLAPSVTIDPSYPPGITAHQIMCLIQSARLALVTSEDKEVLREEMWKMPSLRLLEFSLPDDARRCLRVSDAVRQLNDTHAYSLVEEFAPELLQESRKRQRSEEAQEEEARSKAQKY
ncbi:unnamed protein product [Vitrella brassicaformis CCMP3155]|uniref:Integrase catalytic domain-containing protein n=1 Tax=Vitrella brassicaformis (strain CCMP3155) TaxID=1169540 RepID=A0A0G4GC09_VITBC|nr:unnamed protein product [Vitrella brassicaformis CCMP3155]|eukprot:CEM26654.1 unnamed protein product [Vitrella brassicaformis CCMP3155]